MYQFFFFKQKTAYEMRISDWSSDVCSSDLVWRPFDSFFRLSTARRNPNLVILTVSALFGRPDIGMQIVAAWVLICFVIHGVVIVQGLLAKHRGALTSWLAA